MLKHGANINSASYEMKTPLHSAIFNGNIECIDALYDYVPPKDCPNQILNPYLKTKFGYNNMELACEVELGHKVISYVIEWTKAGT